MQRAGWLDERRFVVDLDGYSDIGPRDANEDNFFVRNFSHLDSFANGVSALAVVSDGMGGYQGGDIASSIVVGQAQSYVDQLLEMASGNQIDLDAAAALNEIVNHAHTHILQEAAQNGGRSMGATFVGAFVSTNQAWIGHVGDSRAYLIRAGKAQQLTEDHSQVGRMLSRGLISEEEAQNHPDRNKIEQALGFTVNGTEIDEVDLEPGDALLLCSDGVYTVLDAEKIAQCVTRAPSAAAAAQQAVRLAVRMGTDDNSTALVIYPDREAPTVQRTGTLSEANQPKNTQPLTVSAEQGAHAFANPTAKMPTVRTHKGARKPKQSTIQRKDILVPLLLGLGLAVFIVGLALSTCNSTRAGSVSGNPESSTPPVAVQENTSSENPARISPQDNQETTLADNPRNDTNPAPSPKTSETPEVSENQSPAEQEQSAASTSETNYSIDYAQSEYRQLQYIDTGGMLRSFVPTGLTFNQYTQVYSQGEYHEVGGSSDYYMNLSNTYLQDLRTDYEHYRTQGTTSFTSEFSKLFDAQDYQAFLSSLSETELNNINALVVFDHSGVAPQENTTYAEEENGGQSDQADPYGNTSQTYNSYDNSPNPYGE